MSYQIKCDKCGNILISATGKSLCFMSSGCKIGCKKCGNQVILTDDMLLNSTTTPEPPKSQS